MPQSLPQKRTSGLMFMLVGAIEMVTGSLGLAFTGAGFADALLTLLLEHGDPFDDPSTQAALAAISSLLYCSGAAIMCLGFTRTAATRGITTTGKMFTIAGGLFELVAGAFVAYASYKMIERFQQLAQNPGVAPADVSALAGDTSLMVTIGFVVLVFAALLTLGAALTAPGLSAAENSSSGATSLLIMAMTTLLAAGMVAGAFISWRAASRLHGLLGDGAVQPSVLADQIIASAAGGLLAGGSLAALGAGHVFMAISATIASNNPTKEKPAED